MDPHGNREEPRWLTAWITPPLNTPRRQHRTETHGGHMRLAGELDQRRPPLPNGTGQPYPLTPPTRRPGQHHHGKSPGTHQLLRADQGVAERLRSYQRHTRPGNLTRSRACSVDPRRTLPPPHRRSARRTQHRPRTYSRLPDGEPPSRQPPVRQHRVQRPHPRRNPRRRLVDGGNRTGKPLLENSTECGDLRHLRNLRRGTTRAPARGALYRRITRTKTESKVRSSGSLRLFVVLPRSPFVSSC